MNEECIHELPKDQCGDCRKPPIGINEFVYVTEQGQAFHNWQDCAFLISGQNFAEKKGFNTHEIVARKWSTVFMSKGACEWCCAVYVSREKQRPDCLVKVDGIWVQAALVRDRYKGHGRHDYQVILKSTGEIRIVDDRNFKH